MLGLSWRASLEEVHSGELLGFPDLAGLLGYLEELACTNPKGLSGKSVIGADPEDFYQ